MTRVLRPRDERWWVVASALVMGVVATFDRFAGERLHAPVGSVVAGPMVAAIACGPAIVAAVVAAALLLRFLLDVSRAGTMPSEIAFNAAMVLLLGGIAVIAATVRRGHERELAVARPAQRLTTLSAALAAARSVDEVKEAFTRMAHDELDARWVRFVLAGDEADPAAAEQASYSAPLVVASGELGRVEIWFDTSPSDDVSAVLEQAVAQVSVALGRAQSAHSLAVTARRLAALQRCTSQLSGLLRTADIARSMVVEARQALQADRAVLHIVDGDVVRVAASDGGVIDPDTTVPLSEDTPVTDAIRTGELVVHETCEAADLAHPRWIRPALDNDSSLVIAPVIGRHGVAAALHLGFDLPHRIAEEERRLVRALATLIGTAWRRAERFEQEERDREQSAHRAERAARLAALAATLADARDRAAVVAAFTGDGLASVDASWGAVFELDDARSTLRVVSGRPSGTLWTAGATIPMDRPIALTQAVRDGRPVTMATREEVLARHPGEDVHPDQHARAAVPLFSYGRVVGALGFAWDAPHDFDAGELEFLQTIAVRTSEALERGRLHEAEREDERRWNLLAEASARLADALEPQDVLNALVRWAVPLIADTCTVYLTQPDGTARPHASVDLPEASDAAELFGQERIDLASEHPIARLHRLRTTVVLDDLPSATLDEAVGGDPRRVKVIRALEIHQAVAAPLFARNQQLGVLLLTMGRSGRKFVETDVELVSDLAARFSIVYDNAVLFATERNIAGRLQAALLPSSLKPPPALDVAVRYAAAGSRAGGDWYDLIGFGDTSAALVVGDLVGHGVEAAATMSRYRSVLRAHARMFEDPAEVMNAYSSFIRVDETGQTATVLYARVELDPARGGPTLSYCSAGHPPPILLHDGRSTVLPSPQGPLIGLVSGGYSNHTTPLAPGMLVVLYTDGLLERRGESLDEGTRRLEQAIRTIPSDDLERFVDELLVAMAHDQHDDDIAVIVARVGGDCRDRSRQTACS